MNSALLHAIGLNTEQDLLGKTDYDFFDTRLADRYREEDLSVMKKGPIFDQIWHVPDPHGRLKWYISTKYPLFNKNKDAMGIVGLMRDVQSVGPALGPYEEYSTVLKYIHENFPTQIKVPDLASQLHVSVSQFEKSFKALFNLTPLQYINKVRFDAASDRLAKTNQSITNIAQECGFYDHTYFAKRFKNEFGLAPKAYREKYKNLGSMAKSLN
jgi:AraC-like DNA-binding protein